MQTKANLQDLFLLRAKRDRVPVTMFLMNGFQMRGTITGYDVSKWCTSTPFQPSPLSGPWRFPRKKLNESGIRRFESEIADRKRAF